MTRSRSQVLGLLAALLAAFAVIVPAAPAQADPPVVVDDAAELYPGNVTDVSVLENDTDPDGDELAVCRVGDERYRGKGVSLEFLPSEGVSGEGLVLLFTKPNAKPGTYTFTYYACDFQTLVPGTITLTVVRPPKITAVALPSQPGKIRVTNPADFKIQFLYGDFSEEDPDGIVRIVKNSSVVLTVKRARIDWVAYSARRFEYLRTGHVKGIKLHRGTTAPAAGRHVSPRVAALWRSF
jgi:hypothetical protein